MAAYAMALPLFAITLFVSAFLLFLVQPMIGKMILPSLGGTPQVWNTCMVFFQTMLLAGYFYTHTVSTRLKLRQQLIVHGILLFVPVAMLFGLGAFNQQINSFFTNNPPSGGNPILMTLLLLLFVVGIPFFVVSTSAPLLQKWFTYTGHPAAKDPYFLYGASNLGSMLSLIAYPFLLEPALGLSDQSWTWAFGYVALVVLFFVCVGMVWKAPPTVQMPGETEARKEEIKAEVKQENKETAFTAKKPEASSFKSKIRKGQKQPVKPTSTAVAAGKPPAKAKPTYTYTEVRSDVMTPWRRLRWVALAFVPSSLMMGIITYISTDVSAIPLFWVIPLALYLLSFILVFATRPVVWTGQPHTLMVIAFPIVFICFLVLLMREAISPVYRSIAFSMLTFFLTAMVCHGELARDRPSPKHLTEFYLWLSVGGMLGGVFNGLIAPVVFWGLAELPIALALACLLRPYTHKLAPVDRPVLIAYCAGLGLIVGVLLLGDDMGRWFGSIIGIIGGAIVGAVLKIERAETNGWTDNVLVSSFPGLGEWFDEKGKELAAESQPAADAAAAQQPEPKKVLVKTKTAPDYYLLNYTLDVALPLLVALLMILLTNYAGMIYVSGGQVHAYGDADGSITKGMYHVFSKTFGMAAQSAQVWANRIGGYFLPFGLPLLCVLMFAFRPIRFGLAVAVILLIGSMENTRESTYTKSLTKTRTYFGVLTVYMKLEDFVNEQEAKILKLDYDKTQEPIPAPYTYLMHGTTHHGLNYQSPPEIRRVATTYYHRLGPVGRIFERFDWFFEPDKTDPLPGRLKNMLLHHADARMPVTLASMGAPLGGNPIPTEQLVALWTEPPYATIGLGTGTMASYGRPFQHCVFYEIDDAIRNFSLGEFDLPDTLGNKLLKGMPERGPYFNYLHDAIQRGVNVEIVMGDARLSQKDDVEELRENERHEKGGANLELRENLAYQHRDFYYHAMVVDAFSSDAIPVHLITKEAIQQYFKKLAPAGVLLVHTSNRHVELTDPVMDIAKDLKLAYRIGHDRGQGGGTDAYDLKTKKWIRKFWGSEARGHFQSEYIMLARDEKYLPPESKEADVKIYRNLEGDNPERLPLYSGGEIPHIIWTTPRAPDRALWTDDYQNLMSVFRWGLRF